MRQGATRRPAASAGANPSGACVRPQRVGSSSPRPDFCRSVPTNSPFILPAHAWRAPRPPALQSSLSRTGAQANHSPPALESGPMPHRAPLASALLVIGVLWLAAPARAASTMSDLALPGGLQSARAALGD